MQPTIGRIVDAFYSSDAERIAGASKLYRETVPLEDIQDSYECCGMVIPKQNLEFDSNNAIRIREYVTPERLEALEEGAEPTAEEREAYRKDVVDGSNMGRETRTISQDMDTTAPAHRL
jgi:hypothetical protein